MSYICVYLEAFIYYNMCLVNTWLLKLFCCIKKRDFSMNKDWWGYGVGREGMSGMFSPASKKIIELLWTKEMSYFSLKTSCLKGGFCTQWIRVNASVILVPFLLYSQMVAAAPAIKSTFQARRKRRQMRCYQLLGQSLGKARDRKMQKTNNIFCYSLGRWKTEWFFERNCVNGGAI